jgi:hypothetical protein
MPRPDNDDTEREKRREKRKRGGSESDDGPVPNTKRLKLQKRASNFKNNATITITLIQFSIDVPGRSTDHGSIIQPKSLQDGYINIGTK